jgi:hypothetical protein
LAEIFTNVLRDLSLNSTYLAIDALDECVKYLPKLLDSTVEQPSASPRIKWIISICHWPDAEERIVMTEHMVRLSLELNAESVFAAFGVFIQQKVHQLSRHKKYNNKTREAVQHHLSLNVDGNLLWIVLVYQNLKDVPRRNVIKKLYAFPPGLDALYDPMMQHIINSDDADVCREILTSAAIAYRPIALVEHLEQVVDDPESIREIVYHATRRRCRLYASICRGLSNRKGI